VELRGCSKVEVEAGGVEESEEEDEGGDDDNKLPVSDNEGRVEDDEEVGKEEVGGGGKEEGREEGREGLSSVVRMSTGIGTDSLSISGTVTDSVTAAEAGSKEVEREVEEEGDGRELNVSSTVFSSLSLNAVATASKLGDRGRGPGRRDGGTKPVTPASESMVRGRMREIEDKGEWEGGCICESGVRVRVMIKTKTRM
jgi:hypothetical protein